MANSKLYPKTELLWEKWKDPFQPISDDDDDMPYKDKHERGRGIVTAMGVIPITEHNSPGKIFNFWVAHSNVSITPAIKNRIKKIPGIEVLKVLTRYRIQIGIGKLFDEDNVKLSVNQTVKGMSKSINNGKQNTRNTR